MVRVQRKSLKKKKVVMNIQSGQTYRGRKQISGCQRLSSREEWGLTASKVWGFCWADANVWD